MTANIDGAQVESGETFDAADPALLQFGLKVVHGGGANAIIVGRDVKSRLSLGVHFAGTGNTLILRDGCRADGTLVFHGNDSEADSGGGHCTALRGTLYANSRLAWGAGSVAYGVRFWAYYDTAIRIGRGCLFSE